MPLPLRCEVTRQAAACVARRLAAGALVHPARSILFAAHCCVLVHSNSGTDSGADAHADAAQVKEQGFHDKLGQEQAIVEGYEPDASVAFIEVGRC